jgi:hypothetical protein
MLHTIQNQWLWNHRAAVATVTPGTSNALGSTQQLVSGANCANDVWEIWIAGYDTALTTVAKNLLANLRVDPAGGTSWTNIITDLSFHCAGNFGFQYRFPLHIAAGSSIGMDARTSHTVAGTLSVRIRIFGRPTRPDVARKGQMVTTFGNTPASSTGTVFTPGVSSAKGAYTQLGSAIGKPYFWWQLGVGVNDATQNANESFTDLAIGDATDKEIIIEDYFFSATNAEALNAPFGAAFNCTKEVSSGNVYVRGSTSIGTADSNYNAIAYGVT